MKKLSFYAPTHIPAIKGGDQIAQIIVRAMSQEEITLQQDDIIVIAHKIVSKAEGRVVALSQVLPTQRALELADRTQKDPRLVQVILEESTEIVRTRKGLLIARHRLGFIAANAAVDCSNSGTEGTAVLLPLDPDKSAQIIAEKLFALTGIKVAVIISDTHGRPFRKGAIGIAVGCYGIAPLRCYQGKKDREGYTLQSSEEGVLDEICSAATLLMGQGDESRPVVIMRGYELDKDSSTYQIGANTIIRQPSEDTFL